MKRFLSIITFAVILLFHLPFCKANHTSQSTFVPRSLITDSSFENSFEFFRCYKKNNPLYKKEHAQTKTYLSTKALYMTSQSGNALARYFFPNDKSAITVAQDGSGDVGSGWIGGISGAGNKKFFANLTMHPKRTVYGSLINVHANLDSLHKGFFAEFKLPLLTVRHELKLKEIEPENPGANNRLNLSDDSTLRTVIDVFNQTTWRYGKLNPYPMTKQGIDDALFRLGCTVLNKGRAFARLYADLILPMGERPSNEYVFEPVVGSKHFGVGAGASLDTLLFNYRNKHFLSMISDARYHYRCSAPEIRTLDLKKNGHWSRYLNLVSEGAGIYSLQGVNFLTRDVDVHPGGSFEALGMLHYDHKYFNCDLGCNIWYRNSEHLEMNEIWNQEEEQRGILYILGGGNITASTATINQDRSTVTPDNSFIFIKESDFDLDSAAHKAAFSYKFFGGISTDHTVFNFPARVGVGYSYEFASSNTALNQWALYLSSHIQF